MNSLDTVSNDQFIFSKVDGFVHNKLGSKLIMEDFYTIDKISDGFYIFGIFDGHGGYHISKILTKLFKKYITLEDHLEKSYLINLCHKIDRELYNKWNNIIGGGSTVLLVLYTDLKTIILNIGDSKAKCYDIYNNIIYESENHNLDNIHEFNRIYSSFQHVITYNNGIRIDNRLSLTRSIGDYTYKKVNNIYNSKSGIITCIPDIRIIDSEKVHHIIMGSDGFWNISNIDNLIDFSKNHFQNDIIQYINTSKKNDNITLIALNIN